MSAGHRNSKEDCSDDATLEMPERKLWAAILSQLLKDSLGSCAHPPPLLERKKAEAQILELGDELTYVCRWLAVEPEEVRRRYLKYKAKKYASVTDI